MWKHDDWRTGEVVESKRPYLEFGWDHAVPEDALAAWGERAITDGSPHSRSPMGLALGRSGTCWKDEGDLERLLKLLNGGILEKMDEAYKQLRYDGCIQGHLENEVVLHDDDAVKAVGTTNASYGYFYVSAWLKEE
jgi:hypothetical protein